MHTSIWNRQTNIRQRDPLPGDLTVDVAIIGGGLAGILTAYYLSRKGVDCAVLEARRIGSGQSGNTTAKITAQHALKYGGLLRDFGEEQARQYADANQKAIREYFRIVGEENIDCDLQERPAYLYAGLEKGDSAALHAELAAAKRLGIEADLTEVPLLPLKVHPALRFPGQAQFDPIKFLSALSEKVQVYENTKALSVKDGVVHTDRGGVTAKKIIFTCHYPFINRPGYYFLRQHQERSYVLALENAPDLQGMYYGIEPEGLSFRNSGPYLLLGGGAHRTGENPEGGRYDLLRRAAEELFPGSREAACWSAQDCIPLDGVPYIGKFSASQPNWLVGTGFQKWGMTSSMITAMVLSKLVTGESHPWPVFSPLRFKLSASARLLAEEGIQAVKGLTKGLFDIPDESLAELPAGHGGIIEKDGHKTGAYKSPSGEVFRVSPRCRHLGCQVEWNPDEQSWDCPCHGSRFDYQGNLLDGPAQRNLNEEDEEEA